MLSECWDLSIRLTGGDSSKILTSRSTLSSSLLVQTAIYDDSFRDNCFGVDYQPPTPAPAREHIIGEDEEEASGNPGSSFKDPSSTSNSSLPSNRPNPAQHPPRPSTNPSRPTPPKPVTHPSRPGGGHPSKVPPPPLSTWGMAPPASMAPPSGPMGRGTNMTQPSSKTPSKPPGRSSKVALPPHDVTLERKKSLNSSIDVSIFSLKGRHASLTKLALTDSPIPA